MEELGYFFRNETHRIRKTITSLKENNGIETIKDFINKYDKLIENAGRAISIDYEHIYHLIPKEYKSPDCVPIQNNRLPINYDNKASLYDSIYMVLSDYAVSIETNGKKDNIRDAKILRMYYGIGCDHHSTIEISKFLGFKKDNDVRVRQILFSDSRRLSIKELFTGKEVNHQILNSELLDKMKLAINLSMYNNRFRELICEGKECEDEKLKRIAEIFEMTMTNNNVIDNLLNARNVIIPKKIEINTFETIIQIVKEVVKDNIYPISKTEIIKNVKLKSQLNEIDEIIIAIIENFDLFVQDNNENYYLKSPKPATMLFLALTELDGIDTYLNIEAKIKEIFQNIDHIDNYRSV